MILLLGMLAVTGCGQRTPEPKLARVSIAFQEWVGYGLFYLAEEKGFMKEEGIELVFIDEQLDSARRDAFKAGMLDLEAGTMDLLVSKAAEDTPIAAVMELDQSNGADAIVAFENIKTLKDLFGKRVAFARDDVSETFIAVLFHEKGLPFNSMSVVPKRPDEVAKAFLDGEADACVTWEPQVTEALQNPGAHILASTKENPGIIIDTLNVRKDLVESHPEIVKGVMRAWFKALQYYRKDPLAASEIIAKYYAITPELYRKQVEGLQWDDYESQKMNSEAKEWISLFDAIAEVKLENARIRQKPDGLKFINRTLIEKLYEDRK